MKAIFVYRHKTDKGVYLKRNYSCCGGSIASHFYSATKNFKDALENSLMAYDEPFEFECHLNTPYSFGKPVDDTVTVIDIKEFEFDGYKGKASKEIKYHLKDFEKVVFVEKQNDDQSA